MQNWQCRIAPSLGDGFAGHPNQVWGTKDYESDTVPTVFFGLYGLPDFYLLWRHQAKKVILWAGSDITHFKNGYWLDDGSIRLDPKPLAQWIELNCMSYVENELEANELKEFGINSEIVPSFLGDIHKYPSCYKPSRRPKVYASVSGNNFEMYGWDLIEKIADKCHVDFYLYGSKDWETNHDNVHIRGRVSQAQMDEEIKEMQCGLRTLEHDGFSEITAKSILWGQYPITRIAYPHIDQYNSPEELIYLLNNLKFKLESNKVRGYYLKKLNNYVFNNKKFIPL